MTTPDIGDALALKVQAFGDTVLRMEPNDGIFSGMSCDEIEKLAAVFRYAGCDVAAESIVEDHATGDDPGDRHYVDPWQSFDRSDVVALSVALEPSFAKIGRIVVAIFGTHAEINGGDLVEDLSQTIDTELDRLAPPISEHRYRAFWRMFATHHNVDFPDDES